MREDLRIALAECYRLRAALLLIRDRSKRRDEGYSENFERLAADFHHDTGLMAPGKSQPLEMGNVDNDRERETAWQEWIAKRNREIYDAMDAALTSPQVYIPSGETAPQFISLAIELGIPVSGPLISHDRADLLVAREALDHIAEIAMGRGDGSPGSIGWINVWNIIQTARSQFRAK